MEDKNTASLPLNNDINKEDILLSTINKNDNTNGIELISNNRPRIEPVEGRGVIYFFFNGKKRRRLSLKHSSTLIGVIILIVVITILFEAVLVPNFWNPFICLSVGIVSAILSILTLYFLFQVSTTIPGYISIKNKLSFEDYIKNLPSIEIEGLKFVLKYCETCSICRDPRSFHCKLCDKCILRHDHHCDFVANCIGKNNFSHFFFFLLFTDLYCIDVTASGMCFYSHYVNDQGIFDKSIVYALIIGIILFFAVISGALLTYFLGYHIYLISTNATTNESIRNKYDNKVFDKGCLKNWHEVFCETVIDLDEEINE